MKRSVSAFCASLRSDCKRAACAYLRCLCWDEFRWCVFDVAPDDSILFRAVMLMLWVVAEASGDTGCSVPLMTDMWLTSQSQLSRFPDVMTPFGDPRSWNVRLKLASQHAMQCEILLWYCCKICEEVKQKCLLQYCTVYSRWSHKHTSFLSLLRFLFCWLQSAGYSLLS